MRLHRSRRVVSWLVALLATLVLSGCMNVNQHVIIHDDGSAAVEVSILVAGGLWDMVKQDPNFDLVALEQAMALAYPGASLEEVEDGNNAGVRFRIPFDSVDEALAALTESYPLFGDAGATSAPWFDEVTYVEAGGPFRRFHRFTGVANGAMMDQLRRAVEATAGAGADLESALTLFDFSFSVTLPEPIAAAEGATVSEDGRTATWDFRVGEAQTLVMETRPVWTPAFWGGGAAVVLIAAAVAFVMLRRRGARQPAEGFAGVEEPRVEPVGSETTGD